MLKKFLNVHRLAHFKSQPSPDPVAPPLPEPEGTKTAHAALRIVHAGGIVESYYMAIPAGGIMEKYPSLVLTKPEVFRRPWDSLVRSDEILTPGNKFYLVPRHTVRKLRRRIKRPNGDSGIRSCMNKSVNTSFCHSEASGSKKKNVANKHVRFLDLEMKKNKAKKEENGHNDKGAAKSHVHQSMKSISFDNNIYD